MIFNNQMVSGILAFYTKLCVTEDTEHSYFGGKCASYFHSVIVVSIGRVCLLVVSSQLPK